MTESLADLAKRTDAKVAAARTELVDGIRAAARAGLTQTQIAREIGRSQPEVNRLLRFHGTSPRAMALRRAAPEVSDLVRAAGGANVRVFGSVATGKDTDESDIDLLFTLVGPMSLMQLSTLERHLAELLGVDVDLVPDSSLRPRIRDRILSEAVPL
jgi:predicted nucleotidyltransferase